MRKLAIMIAITAIAALVLPGWVQQAQETTRALEARSEVPEPSTNPTTDPCLECDVIYAGDSGRGLWRIDQVAGTSTFIGNMPFNMFDMAISSDGRLFGVRSNGRLYEISACDASGVLRTTVSAGNGLTGDIFSTDLFVQGPPLRRIQTSGTFPIATIGGSIGPGPPGWCGASSGDLAMNPDNGLLYSALGCSACASAGDMLVTIDPATGNVLSEVGCIQDAGGNTFPSVFGLAFDSDCNLWGGNGFPDPSLIRIDPATAIATVVSISGGYNAAFGLASCPIDVLCRVALDIKPGSCPNSFNRNSNGILPVALVGDPAFDVGQVDLTTVQLERADDIGGSVQPNEGPPGPHSVVEDVATPFNGELCDCHELTGDGIDDLSMKFKSQEVVAALELNDLPPGALVELCVSGELLDGTEFEACDCVRLVPPGDIDGDGLVGVADLLRLLAQWGQCGPTAECSADYNGDTMVGVVDLLIMLGNWG